VREEIDPEDRQGRSAARILVGALLLGAAGAVVYLLWRRLGEEDGGVGSPPPEETTCFVDEVQVGRITLDRNGNVVGHDPKIEIRIPKGDTRRYGVEWRVNNRNGAFRRDVHIANVRRDTKRGARRDIFEPGSDRRVMPARLERSFYSCLLPDVETGRYCYDILIDGALKVDPELAIIRGG